MKRSTAILYTLDSGRTAIKIFDDKANIDIYGIGADELRELASACEAAAEELSSGAEVAEMESHV